MFNSSSVWSKQIKNSLRVFLCIFLSIKISENEKNKKTLAYISVVSLNNALESFVSRSILNKF